MIDNDWLQTLIWIHHPNGFRAFFPEERSVKNKKANKAATIEGLVFVALGLQRIWKGGEAGLRQVGRVMSSGIADALPAISGLLRSHQPTPPSSPPPFVTERRPSKARRKPTTTRKKA